MPTWEVHWRAILPATTPGTAHATATLEAILSPERVELTLRDQQGAVLGQQWFEAVTVSIQTGNHLLLEWASPGGDPHDPKPNSVLIRVLLEAGREPLIRTTLPETMGLAGGRYDLMNAAAISKPTAMGTS